MNRRTSLFPRSLLLLCALLLPISAGAQDDTDLARELLEASDDMYRGLSSYAKMTMNVKTSRFERSLTMEAWSRGTEKSLIIIRSPAKEAGTATLKVNDNIWNYLPKVDRTMKVPAGMMGGSWMGSHFTNDDLVKESRMADDFTYRITQRPEDNADGLWLIELTPKPDAAVVWGKVIVKVRGLDKITTEVTYYDEKGELKRTMQFSDIKQMGGRTIPTRMRLVPEDKPGEYTEMVYEALELNIDVPDTKFSLQELKK